MIINKHSFNVLSYLNPFEIFFFFFFYFGMKLIRIEAELKWNFSSVT